MQVDARGTDDSVLGVQVESLPNANYMDFQHEMDW